MKKIPGILLFVTLAFSCQQIYTSPQKLIGKWDNTYYVQTLDSTGKWSDWTLINTFAALPQLEFTSEGKILWDGKPSTSCCSYLSYALKGNKIHLSDPAASDALCNCAACDVWEIEKLTDEILEIDMCYSKVRYSRAK